MLQLARQCKNLLRLTIIPSCRYRNFESEVTFNIRQPKLYLLTEGPPATTTLSRRDALLFFKQLVMLRKLESAAAQLYREKLIRGFCHLYSGEEAIAVGIKAALRPDDCVITSYRSHAWCYVMGITMFGILAELAGFKTGCSRGKGGSMHMYQKRFYGGNGIVGAQVPLGLGISFALKYQGKPGLCVTLYGDGAANQGQVFEAFNIAKLWKIPCIFICENNLYGMGTAVERASAMPELYKRGHYIPGMLMDAMDVLTVRECAKFAIDYCTANMTPLVIEAITYRYYGHSMSDPGTSYRDVAEVKDIRVNRDPVIKLREKILAGNLASAAELSTIEKVAKQYINGEVKRVKEQVVTEMSDLTSDIYKKNIHDSIRGISPYENHEHHSIGKPFSEQDSKDAIYD